MGYERHNAIIVSASYQTEVTSGTHWIEVAHEKACELFADVAPVTDPTPPAVNNVRSFLVAPDGSKEGWDDSDQGDTARDRYIEWLRERAYADGSSPLAWVEVQYRDDDRVTKIVRHSDELPVA